MRMYSARPGGTRYHPVPARPSVGTSGTLALLAGGALALGLGGFGALHSGRPAFVAYLALCGLVGAFSRPRAAPLVGLAGWLCGNALAEHHHAELGWSGIRWEGGHYVVFTAAALLLAVPAALPRRTVRVSVVRLDPPH
ncbi:hypothetical protein ACFV0O_27960 [Kitasatospora sp. NPDC059577]|uniref:hypothetical protein n=1 Tax=Kitasatospora sp. NPDC059577 TaxID=3346873 RepID=UPI0036CF4D4B